MFSPKRAHVALVLLLTLVACTARQRRASLRVTLGAVDSARAGLIVWDAQAQGQIVKNATSLDDGLQRFEIHRSKRDKVVRAFELVYRAIAIAASVPSDPNMVNSRTAVTDLWHVYQGTVGSAPPGAILSETRQP